jgi:hypothetical protein
MATAATDMRSALARLRQVGGMIPTHPKNLD